MNEHNTSRGAEPWSAAPPAVRDALAAARADLPSASQLARLTVALPMVPRGVGQAPSAATGVGVGAAATPSTLSGALIGAALGVLVSGAALFGPPRTEPARAHVAAPTADAVPALAPTSASASESASGFAPNPSRRLEESRGEAREEARPPRPSGSVGAAASIARPSPSSAAAPSPSATAGGEPLPHELATGPAPAPDDTETEAHLLERAQDALTSSPEQALALAERHATRFARGGLGQEREVVAIQALLRLGRAEDARARANRLLAAHPGSAYRPRIEALLAR